jgi:beta-glucuronidase
VDGLSKLVTWTACRQQESLNGSWPAIIDVYDVGASGPFGGDEMFAEMFGFPADRGRHSPGRRAEYDFDTSVTVEVPGDWNTQIERFHFYEGSMWLRRRFAVAAADTTTEATRTFISFGAANHLTWVYLNSKRIAEHEGGFGPFCVEVTGKLRTDGENSLIVRVNNRRSKEAIPTTRTDWFNYGGVTRDVRMIRVPNTFVRDAVVQLDPCEPDTIMAEVWLDGPSAEQQVAVAIDGTVIGHVSTDTNGHGTARFAAPAGLTRWSPSNPVLHDVEVRAETDSVKDRIGFRTIKTVGTKILLNGEPIFFAGISAHDEAITATSGAAHRITTEAQARELLGNAKALGANFVRLAHYQHNEITVRMCDELGLLAWAEVPVYWGIDWENPDTLENGRAQLRELIERDRNRASVVLWSVANETPPSAPRLTFLRNLVALARELDPTRLITAALFSRPEGGGEMSFDDTATKWLIDDPLGEDLDVLGVNEYHGWYYGTLERMKEITWESPFNKPLIVSEFGADAKAGLRGAANESWTEDFQAEVYKAQLAMLEKIPFLAGLSPWILKDFRAPFRVLPGVQDGFNRKGLISDTGERKLSFAIMADWYRDRLNRPA